MSALGVRRRSEPVEQPDRRWRRPLGFWLASVGSSLCADEIFFLALTWATIAVGSAAQVGAVVAAASLPRIVVSLVGGALADRLDTRLLAAATDLGRTVALGAAAALVLAVDLQVWHLVVIAVVVGALDGLFMPAVGALPALIAPAALMGRVGGMRTVVQRVALLLAGPLGGTAVALAGQVAGFATAAAVFACSVAALLLIGRPPAAPQLPPVPAGRGRPSGVARSFLADLGGGLAIVQRQPAVLWLLLVAAVLNLGFAGPVTAGLPLLAQQEQWGPSGAGLLLGALGAGAAASGLTVTFARQVPRPGLVMLVALAVMGAAIAGFAWAAGLVAALASALVLGVGSGVVGSVVHGTLLAVTPAAALGRVMALLSLTLEGTFPVSTYLTGVATQSHGAGLPFLVGGGLLLLAAAAAASRPAVRTLTTAQPA